MKYRDQRIIRPFWPISISLCNLCVLCVSVVMNSLVRATTETLRTQRSHREIGLLRNDA
jgi:hypothetical protein